MRRFVTVVALLFFTVPFGISISGCGKKAAIVYCNGGDSGVAVGQVVTISLQPKIFGVSVNQAQISQVSTPAAVDCKGNAVTLRSLTYGTSDMTIADIQPNTGRICGGTWNRNTGGGIADYTTCNSTGKSGIAYITATSNGTSSNPLPVYVHPVVSSVVLGAPSADCFTDPATNCSPAATNTSLPASAEIACNVATAQGCCATPAVGSLNGVTLNPYTATGCVSQQGSAQLAARVYAGTGANRTNISCQVGHIAFSPQAAGIVSIDQNGVATAQQPGSTIIDTTVSLSGSSAGFFSTCPPGDISLSYPGSSTGTTNIVVDPNNTQPITATVTDVKGLPLTGLTLEYVSTTPITIPASSNGTVTPVYPGQASITAICQPPACNTAPQSELGVFGNGKSITSKPVTITTPGTNSEYLYIASTDSQYIVAVDFTQTQLGAPVRLPYVPNSLAITNDGTKLFLGSSNGLMTLSTFSLALTATDTTVRGNVLAVSPDNSTLVVSDPIRGQTYLYSTGGGVITLYGGTATHAAWSPDSQTVYIAAGNQVLVHSAFSGWKSISPATPSGDPVTDVTVTVPAVGAYFAGSATTARGYCPATATVPGTSGNPPAATNVFYPLADTSTAVTDRVAGTNDGLHILGAAAATATLNDIEVSLASTTAGSLSASGGIVCPQDADGDGGGPGLTFASTFNSLPIAGITPTSITGVLPTSDSRIAFVTYTGTGGILPYYLLPAATAAPGTAGTLSPLPLAGSTAPVSGAISADNSTIFVGTSGDNLIHIVNTGSSPAGKPPVAPTDTKTIAPALPSATGATGAFAVPDLLVEHPRKAT